MVPDYDAILRPMVETFAKQQRRTSFEVVADMREALDRIVKREIARTAGRKGGATND